MSENNKKPKPWLYFSGLGLQMAIVIVGSVFFGIWLDKTYTESSRVFTIMLSLLGIFIALIHVITSLKKFKE